MYFLLLRIRSLHPLCNVVAKYLTIFQGREGRKQQVTGCTIQERMRWGLLWSGLQQQMLKGCFWVEQEEACFWKGIWGKMILLLVPCSLKIYVNKNYFSQIIVLKPGHLSKINFYLRSYRVRPFSVALNYLLKLGRKVCNRLFIRKCKSEGWDSKSVEEWLPDFLGVLSSISYTTKQIANNNKTYV